MLPQIFRRAKKVLRLGHGLVKADVVHDGAEFFQPRGRSGLALSARKQADFRVLDAAVLGKGLRDFAADGFLWHQIHLQMKLAQFGAAVAGPTAAIFAPPKSRKS